MMIRFRNSAALVFALLLTCTIQTQIASAQSAAQSKDYWVSYLPSKKPTAAIWLLMCTNVENTKVTIYYSATGQKDEVQISPNKPLEYKILRDNNAYLTKPTQPEVAENRSVHVVASNPISMQGFTDEDNNVGLFLALPTSSLGQKYVIAAYNDQPWAGFPNSSCYSCFDSSSGGFVITAPEDNTVVTINAHSPTKGGHQANQPWTVTLNQGQTYWVQGAAKDDQDDLSQSTVTATKPVAVIAGAEVMRALDAMVIAGHFDYNDFIIEQMLPVEEWGTDYVSAPFTNKRGTNLDKAGDLYRVFGSEPTSITFNGRVQNVGTYWEFPLTTDPVHITSDKPVMVVQYDYYEDFHSANTPRTSNSEMVLVPRHNWRRNATFKVPTGYALTYFAVAANKDSIDQIQVSLGGGPPHAIGTLPPGLKYQMDGYAVRVIQLDQPLQAIITGKCDFAVYNYGTRDNDAIKATYGYAAAAAASFGSISTATPPKMKMDSSCTTFNLTLYDSSVDGRGIGDIFLLNDPKGLVYRGIPYVSTNVLITVDKFDLGSKSVTAHVTVQNALLDAFAAVYVTDRAGKDTVFTFHYAGVKIAANPPTQFMQGVLYGSGACVDYMITNTGTKALPINGVTLESITNHQPSSFTLTTSPALPATLLPNQSVTIHVCFSAQDTGVINTHRDSLQLVTDCYTANLAEVKGYGAVPLIYSEDVDFGNVVVGSTKCLPITIQNVSTYKDMVLTKNSFFSSSVFSLDPNDLKRLPITLHPGEKTTVNGCYSPNKPGHDTTITLWGSDIPMPFSHDKRDTSILTGSAIKAGVNWDLSNAKAQTICVRDTIFSFKLQNTGDADANVDTVIMIGPDAAEFTILKIGSQQTFGSFSIGKGSSLDVQVQFVANTSGANPWRARAASLLIRTYYGASRDSATVDFKANVSHPTMAASVNSLSFAEVDPGVAQTQNFNIDNKAGTSPLTIASFSTTDPTFTVVSGLAVGQILQPGEVVSVGVQALNGAAGKFLGILNINSAECGGNIALPLVANFASRAVSAQGAIYDTTWTCESNQQFVEFCNKGSKPVLLKGARLSGSDFGLVKAVNSGMFHFGDMGPLGKLTNDSMFTIVNGGIWLKQDSCIQMPVLYNPTATGAARGVVTFSYDTGDGTTQLMDRQVIATARILPVEITTASGAAPYSAIVDQNVDVPISVKQDLGVGNLYGYDFDVKYNDDLFVTQTVTGGDPGYAPMTTSVVTRSGDTNFAIIHISAKGTAKIQDGQRTLAHLILKTRLSSMDTTAITPMNLMFYRADGSSVCYTPATHDPAMYLEPLRCGEKTIQTYMLTGGKLVQLDGTSPNPSKGQTTITFSVRGENTLVTAEIYDMLGNKVANLIKNAPHNSGQYALNFDASHMTSGSYYCRISAASGTQNWTATGRLTIAK